MTLSRKDRHLATLWLAGYDLEAQNAMLVGIERPPAIMPNPDMVGPMLMIKNGIACRFLRDHSVVGWASAQDIAIKRTSLILYRRASIFTCSSLTRRTATGSPCLSRCEPTDIRAHTFTSSSWSAPW